MDPANKEEMQQCLQEANEEFSERKDQEMAKAVMHAAAGIVATEEGHHNDCIKDIRGARNHARSARPRARAPSPRAPARRRNLTAHPRTARAAALTGQVQSRHQELAKRRADDPVAKQKVELLGERNRTEEHVKAQQAEVDRHRDAIASEERRGVELGAAGEALKQREAVEVPRARHKISLFANISSIRWDYQGTDDATLKGYVLNGEQMEQFAVDTRAKNDFAAINQLWGLVGA